jgi:hypothetical protein
MVVDQKSKQTQENNKQNKTKQSKQNLFFFSIIVPHHAYAYLYVVYM